MSELKNKQLASIQKFLGCFPVLRRRTQGELVVQHIMSGGHRRFPIYPGEAFAR